MRTLYIRCYSFTMRLFSYAWIHSRLCFWSRTISSWEDYGFFCIMVWMHRFLPRLFLGDLEEQVWSQDVTSRIGCSDHQGLDLWLVLMLLYCPLQFLSGEGLLCLCASPQGCYRRSSGIPLTGSCIPKALSEKLGTDIYLEIKKLA